ncbi:serine/threonine protein kinase [Nocardiopsis listeri]|uniref:serine/threonine protein kinase n=1 Tax=Nocardiopsis listeri TaxID=53440 RepID=UPI000830136B|nr:serine/threonine-protein kinase [Nocardiopsis listeri]
MPRSTALPVGVSPLVPDDPTHLGPFRVLGRLGSGGMGVVYAALDGRDRRVAVKCVHRTLASDADFRDRFAREVNLVRRVRAACVPAFHSADAESEVPWLATEYVPGPTLREYVRIHGPLRGDALTAFALGVAEALAAVHAAGVVHRDLKPGNVILAPDGPKVLDFGIARAIDGTALTRTGGLVGTPGWISPEQYRGAPASGHSDIFSWAGLVAYAATGQGPFGSGPSDVVVSRILSGPPSLTGVPAHLRHVLERALSKEPEQRPTATELQRIMTGALHVAAPSGVVPADIRALLGRAWAGLPVLAIGDQDWRRIAPPGRGRFRRNRLAVGLGAAVPVMVLVAGLGLRALLGEGPSETSGAADADAPGGATVGNAVVPDDAPEEYQELYETGEIVVEPVSETEPVLLRRLEPASGEGEGLDQLRLTFDSAATAEFQDFGLTVELEYLPDHGSLNVHSNEFVGVTAITPGQEGLDFTPAGNSGVLARLDPDNPTESVRLAFYDVRVVYHVPDSTRERAQDAVDYPGGFCVYSGLVAAPGADSGLTFPGMDDIGPHDTTLTDGAPLESCAYTDDTENQ